MYQNGSVCNLCLGFHRHAGISFLLLERNFNNKISPVVGNEGNIAIVEEQRVQAPLDVPLNSVRSGRSSADDIRWLASQTPDTAQVQTTMNFKMKCATVI